MSLSAQHLLSKYIEAYALDSHLNADLLRALTVYQFEAGQEVYTANQELKHLYFLVHGKAQISHYLPTGKRSIIAFLRPFNIIGDIEIFKDELLNLDVVTTETSIFLGLKKTDVLQYGYDDPRFLRFIIHYMSSKLHGRGYAVLSNALPLINRVALYLSGQVIEDNVITAENKALVADLLGTTARHLNRVIKILEDEAIISWDKNRVTVLDMLELQSYGEI